MIKVENIVKQFKILNAREGIIGSVKDIFLPNYRYINAVNGISFSINKGDVVGFLGPNGAGKSTTLKMLIGALLPTSGTLDVGGFCPFSDRKHYVRNIGVVFGQRSQLWWDIPVIESFKVLKEIYVIESETYNRNMSIFMGLGDFRSLLDIPVRNLSLGQRMLCDIFSAFLHSPEVVFMDEPTIGLDISIKSKIREMIIELNKSNGTTMIVTSHDIGDIEETCNRIIMIDSGNIIYDGNTSGFRRLYGRYRKLKLKFSSCYGICDSLVNDLDKRYCTDYSLRVEEQGEDWICITFNEDTHNIIDLIDVLIDRNGIVDIRVDDISMSDVVKRIYERAQ